MPESSTAERARVEAILSPTQEAAIIRKKFAADLEKKDPERPRDVVRLGEIAFVQGHLLDAGKFANLVTNKVTEDPSLLETNGHYAIAAASAHTLLGTIEVSKQLETDEPDFTQAEKHFAESSKILPEQSTSNRFLYANIPGLVSRLAELDEKQQQTPLTAEEKFDQRMLTLAIEYKNALAKQYANANPPEKQGYSLKETPNVFDARGISSTKTANGEVKNDEANQARTDLLKKHFENTGFPPGQMYFAISYEDYNKLKGQDKREDKFRRMLEEAPVRAHKHRLIKITGGGNILLLPGKDKPSFYSFEAFLPFKNAEKFVNDLLRGEKTASTELTKLEERRQMETSGRVQYASLPNFNILRADDASSHLKKLGSWWNPTIKVHKNRTETKPPSQSSLNRAKLFAEDQKILDEMRNIPRVAEPEDELTKMAAGEPNPAAPVSPAPIGTRAQKESVDA